MMKELREDLGDSCYSLILDESTNIANIQCLGLIIRYYSVSRRCIVDTMYRLVPVAAATADALFGTVKDCLAEDNLSLDKLIGIGCDGASTMVGCRHSVATLMKEHVPNLVVVKCICHSLHLAACKAVDLLPVALEFLVREAHKWFSCSPKRSLAYKKLFDIMNEKGPTKIPGHCDTRWLAKVDAITTILDQWDVLQLHFQMAAQTERCYTANQLAQMFADKQNRLYCLCMRQVLKEITKVNKLFQSQFADITKLTDDLLHMHATLMQLVVIPTELEKCGLTNLPTFSFQNHLMPTRCVHFGFEFEQLAATLPSDVVTSIRERCRDFVLELIEQVQIRLPENLKTLCLLSNFSPTCALSQVKPPIGPICQAFPQLITDMDDAENEWNALHLTQWPADVRVNIVDFWVAVSLAKNAENAPRFGQISKLALSLLSLPFSNATVERLFSLMNVVHSKLRNRMHVRSVEAVLQIRYGLKLANQNCVTFKPSAYMLKHFFDKSADTDDDSNNDRPVSVCENCD